MPVGRTGAFGARLVERPGDFLRDAAMSLEDVVRLNYDTSDVDAIIAAADTLDSRLAQAG